MNKVILVGRTTKDIEVRVTPTTGSYVAQFTLAVDRKDKEKTTDFINCVAWNKAAELLSQYVHKGDRVGVVGKIITRNYKDKDNKTVYVTEILVDEVEFMQDKKTTQVEENSYNPPKEESLVITGDDLPF